MTHIMIEVHQAVVLVLDHKAEVRVVLDQDLDLQVILLMTGMDLVTTPTMAKMTMAIRHRISREMN